MNCYNWQPQIKQLYNFAQKYSLIYKTNAQIKYDDVQQKYKVFSCQNTAIGCIFASWSVEVNFGLRWFVIHSEGRTWSLWVN